MLGGYYGFDGEPISGDEWWRLWQGERHVARTEVGGVEVSTVWLGLDHSFGFGPDGPPLIYETMIFGGAHHEERWRFPNRVAALAGHDQAVALASEEIGVEP